jgi:hypothetical protein
VTSLFPHLLSTEALDETLTPEGVEALRSSPAAEVDVDADDEALGNRRRSVTRRGAWQGVSKGVGRRPKATYPAGDNL